MLSLAETRSRLRTRTFGWELIVLPSTGSTNDVAKERAAQGAPEGLVVVADVQTAGRGRMARRWNAPPGACLLCSILFRPTLPLARANQLTMLCSLAAADAIAAVTGLHVALKWPNDLIIPSPTWRKLAGVLTESGVSGERLEFVVVGLGVNVNVPAEILPTLDPNAASILAETGRYTERAELLAELLARVEERYARLQAGEGPYAEWSARLATVGQVVTLAAAEEMFTGLAEGVDEDGALLLRAPEGTLRRFLVGDITKTLKV